MPKLEFKRSMLIGTCGVYGIKILLITRSALKMLLAP